MKIRLSWVNHILLGAIIAVNLYLVILPVLPALLFKVNQHGPNSFAHLTQKLAGVPAPKLPAAAPTANELIIPIMQYDQPIIEGKTIRALHYGPWREPLSSTPPAGGNTVIAGHRFTYTNPRGTFYYLNKLHIGDQIGIIWQGRTYHYTVAATEVVPPSDTSVEAPTARAQLTLYTCTPLWLPKNRLVVVANLESTT